jgi:hypothetical protein
MLFSERPLPPRLSSAASRGTIADKSAMPLGLYSEDAGGASRGNEIAGLFRHAADELDEAAMTIGARATAISRPAVL